MRRLTTHIRTVLLLLFIVCAAFGVHAYDFKYNGIYYNITGSNTVKVTHADDLSTYSGSVSIPSTAYNSSENKSYQVTSIGMQAFASSIYLTSVSIPNSITDIEYCAFEGCTSLLTVAIPNSVRRIEEGAFKNCDCLTSVTIGSSVYYIEDYVFYPLAELSERILDPADGLVINLVDVL